MSLLAPIYLLIAAAAMVPLLIHLLRRRAGARVEFPAARYLVRTEQEHRRTLRLRNLLLMILRVAAVLLVTLAAARPVGRWLGAGHAPAAVAFVVDNSLSTGVVEGGRPLFDQIRGIVSDVLARATPSDRLWLVTADGTVIGGSPSILKEAIARLRPIGGAGDLHGALARAAGLVRVSGLESRQVAVLTDGQRTSWPQQAAPIDGQILIWSPNTVPPPTHAVTVAEARPPRWTPRGAVITRVRSVDSVAFRVTIAGRALARGTAPPGEDVTIHAAPPERGWVSGAVEIEPDELPGDNVRYFAAWIGAAPGVVVSDGAGPFLKSAVDVLRASGQVGQSQEIAVVPADELTRVPAFIVAPADPTRFGTANRALERAQLPWRFGARHSGTAVAVTGDRLGQVTVSDRYDLIPEAGAVAETLAASGSAPWIVSGPHYVLIGSPVDPRATTLPVRAAFIPWFSEVLTDRLSGEPGAVIAAEPGARIPRPLWADALESPDGSRSSLTDPVVVPQVAGTYFLINGSRRVGAITVNPPAAELVLDRLTPTELAARMHNARALAAPSRAAFVTMAFGAASRRSLIDPLLIAALVVLLVEGVVVTARRRPVAAV